MAVVQRLLEWRRGDGGPGEFNETLLRAQMPMWDVLCRYYFRLDVGGWDRIPKPPCLFVGVHSGGTLTMDAWTLLYAWWRRFENERLLHGTAHDVLMALPGLGDYFRQMGVLPAAREPVGEALAAGYDVIVWPGGEKDSMRRWTERDTAVLGGRAGFVHMALDCGVPIVPVATIGGHDTVFVLSEGRFLADSPVGRRLRAAKAPIVLGPPFGIALEVVPAHIPLPAKIRTEFQDPIRLDRERADDERYVDEVYERVRSSIQSGMDRLASKRRFPIFG